MARKTVSDLRVGPEKNRPGLLVIEIFGIEHNDRFLRSLMLGMTHDAILTLVPVISFLSGYPLGHLRVAVQAFLGGHLQFFIMAFIATGKPRRILMNGTQISRRIGHIEFLLPLKKRGEQEERNDYPDDEEKGCCSILFINVS